MAGAADFYIGLSDDDDVVEIIAAAAAPLADGDLGMQQRPPPVRSSTPAPAAAPGAICPQPPPSLQQHEQHEQSGGQVTAGSPPAQQQQQLRPGSSAEGEQPPRLLPEQASTVCALCQLTDRGNDGEALGRLLTFDVSKGAARPKAVAVHTLCAAWLPRVFYDETKVGAWPWPDQERKRMRAASCRVALLQPSCTAGATLTWTPGHGPLPCSDWRTARPELRARRGPARAPPELHLLPPARRGRWLRRGHLPCHVPPAVRPANGE